MATNSPASEPISDKFLESVKKKLEQYGRNPVEGVSAKETWCQKFTHMFSFVHCCVNLDVVNFCLVYPVYPETHSESKSMKIQKIMCYIPYVEYVGNRWHSYQSQSIGHKVLATKTSLICHCILFINISCLSSSKIEF